jgi:hypothetical protein
VQQFFTDVGGSGGLYRSPYGRFARNQAGQKGGRMGSARNPNDV